MRNLNCILLFLIFSPTLIFSCKKNPSDLNRIEPINVADSTFKITGATQVDINDFNLKFYIKPPQGESYRNVYLHWSSDSSFTSSDSILISSDILVELSNQYSLKRLKENTFYYSRVSLIYKGKKFYSVTSSFKTDILKFVQIPNSIVRNNSSHEIVTNFFNSSTSTDTSTRVFLDDILCPITMTTGHITYFIPPTSLKNKKYSLRFERNGISLIAPDSIEVDLGIWKNLIPPNIPTPIPGYENAIANYGSCFSTQKGYIIPGHYYREFPYGHQEFGKPEYILEFDLFSHQWMKKYPVNPKYFTSPTVYYFNNAIYVIAGYESNKLNGDYKRITNTYRLDLSNMTWIQLGPVPHPNQTFLPSFELNGEFYIGLGPDISRMGYPEPVKTFWKYNPSTDVWKQLADFPVDLSLTSATKGFTIGNTGYIFFSDLGFTPLRGKKQELWKFNPDNNSWTEINLPNHPNLLAGGNYSIATYNGMVYFFTCEQHEMSPFGNIVVSKNVYLEYNPITNSFKNIAIHPNISILNLIGSVGNKIYFQEGTLGQITSVYNRTYEFTIE